MFWLYPNSKNREEVRKQRIRCPYDPGYRRMATPLKIIWHLHPEILIR